MVIALGVVVAVFLALLLVGTVTGRVTVKSCCAVADPRRDLRMRDAFPEATPTGQSDQPTGATQEGTI
ncbi:MAG: hypothetical protein LC749_19415 [Actinobacteria bacterium]|nr:hypothetical protein [Actinomycetota bacterium]